jgi:uncharacterized membrane protein (UPF0127 family)
MVPKWYEGIGLMFHRRKNAKALLFGFRNPVRMPIHSFFVFFPFTAIWMDEKWRIIDVKVVKPFEFGVSPSEKFTRLLEIPSNERYDFFEFPTAKERFK